MLGTILIQDCPTSDCLLTCMCSISFSSHSAPIYLVNVGKCSINASQNRLLSLQCFQTPSAFGVPPCHMKPIFCFYRSVETSDQILSSRQPCSACLPV